MSDCPNLDMRDLLPDLARGGLRGPSRVALEAHLVTCDVCRAELDVVRKAHAVLSVAPSVDAPRIAAAVARSTALRRNAATSVAQARRRRAWSIATPARRSWLAAASIAAIAGAAIFASIGDGDRPSRNVPSVVVRTDPPAEAEPVTSEPTPLPRAASRAELVMGGGVSDLADADLESLLEVLEDVDIDLDLDPTVLSPVLEGDV